MDSTSFKHQDDQDQGGNFLSTFDKDRLKIVISGVGAAGGGWIRSLWLVAASTTVAGHIAVACDTPVFRYSMQSWPPDAYEMVVVHSGGVEAERLLEGLNSYVDKGANLVVRQCAPAETANRFGVALNVGASLPWLLVRYPVRQDRRVMLWSGAGGEVPLATWFDSPRRREIARLLLEGSAGAWVVLDGVSRVRSDAAYEVLTSELARLERTMRIEDEAGHPQQVAFGVVRMARGEREERMLERMLLGSEPDLGDLADEPMVFPIYGRGVILYALVGKGINEATIREAADFLTGECSCEVKSLNPGLELLMDTDWGEVVAVATGFDSFSGRAEQAATMIEEVEGAADNLTEAVLPDMRKSGISASRLIRFSVIILAFVLFVAFIIRRFLRGGRAS